MCIFCLYGGQRQCLELYQCETVCGKEFLLLSTLMDGLPLSVPLRKSAEYAHFIVVRFNCLSLDPSSLSKYFLVHLQATPSLPLCI